MRKQKIKLHGDAKICGILCGSSCSTPVHVTDNMCFIFERHKGNIPHMDVHEHMAHYVHTMSIGNHSSYVPIE